MPISGGSGRGGGGSSLTGELGPAARQQLGMLPLTQFQEDKRRFDLKFGLQGDLLQQLLGNFPGLGGGGGGLTSPSFPEGGGLTTPGFPDDGLGSAPPSFRSSGPRGGSLLDQLAGFGAGQRARIEQDFANTANTAEARLVDRGLGGSVLVDAARRGAQREKQLSMGELEDKILKERIGVQERAADRGIDLVRALTGIFGAL